MRTSGLSDPWRAKLTARGAAAVLLVATFGCGADGDRPAMTIFPDMMESVPHDTFEANPVAASGGMLLPPEGTVPISGAPFHYGPGEEEAVRAGEELMNPMLPTAENLTRGQHQYSSACAVCHGPSGAGDGPIIGRFPNPPSLTTDHARSYADGRIYHLITHGQGIMPPHALQVLPDDRWRLVLYVRQLQGLVAADEDAGQASPPAIVPPVEPDAVDLNGGAQ
jgi:mono/diheme cytochrome c family protein